VIIIIIIVITIIHLSVSAVLSIALQRGNAVAFLNTFDSD